jgi:hypothetical protein
VSRVKALRDEVLVGLDAGNAVREEAVEEMRKLLEELDPVVAAVGKSVSELEEQTANRDKALAEKQRELAQLEAAVELGRLLGDVRSYVAAAKRSDKLGLVAKGIPPVLRQITSLSKLASDRLINQNFEEYFDEECRALRTKPLRLEFIGREGKAHRRKVMTGEYRPSRILSEGEQKVLAIADFLAEARLTGITAPIVFDDPVCSLDHRRIHEVAVRVAHLAKTEQVLVFTHDILFATTLLALFESDPSRCTYLQVTDEDGVKGQVAHASGPRWDTIKNLTKRINETLDAAGRETGESRAALIRTGYDWLRSWCEVFVEMELLAGATQRYQPNVRMTVLPQIKADHLASTTATVVRIFEDACRYIDGHSQPLATLSVAPTLDGLTADWKELQECRKAYLSA